MLDNMLGSLERSELLQELLETGVHPAAFNDPLRFDNALGIPRNPEWEGFRNKVLVIQPWCSVCRSLVNVQVHHIKPFHLFPEYELDPNNVIPLCQGRQGLLGRLNCHFVFGHFGDWQHFNPDIITVVNDLRQRLDEANQRDENPTLLFPRKSLAV